MADVYTVTFIIIGILITGGIMLSRRHFLKLGGLTAVAQQTFAAIDVLSKIDTDGGNVNDRAYPEQEFGRALQTVTQSHGATGRRISRLPRRFAIKNGHYHPRRHVRVWTACQLAISRAW